MHRAHVPASERALYSELQQILTRPGLLRGSLVDSRRMCGKAACRCHRERRYRHRALYVGVSFNGKARMICVPWEWEKRVREWIHRYGQVRQVLEKLSRACLKRLQSREA